jgi:hypothetical protein
MHGGNNSLISPGARLVIYSVPLEELMLFFYAPSAALIAGILLFLFPGSGERDTGESKRQTILAIVQDYSNRLGITEPIEVMVSTDKQRLVSVRRLKDESRSFLITFDDAFLAALTEEELRAAVAHELGHIWIFTRRPYLQTEALANRKAAQLVPAESLDRLYLKVSEFGGKTQPMLAVSSVAIR